MSALKAIAKRGLMETVARVAPLTWKWHPPGSLVVLMYHRVLPASSPARREEQPGMYVSPEVLDLHLSEIRRRFELVHLEDWLRRAREGRSLPRIACAITFDDGWRDNFEFALPVLLRHGAPATVFLVSAYIGTDHRFWPNRLMSLLGHAFDDPGSVEFPARLQPAVLPVLAEARKRGGLRVEDSDRAVEAAKRFHEEEIRELICAAEVSCTKLGVTRDLLSAQEVSRLASCGLIRFGSHSATHFRLGGHVSQADLEREVVFSKRQLREMCGQDIDLFCYPNGETSAAAIDLIRRNYVGAVTTRRGWHMPAGDSHLVPRVGVHEDVSNSPELFLARLSAWI